VAGVNVYVKRKLRLDLLNVTQRQMYDLGNKALKAVKYRIDRHQDSRDMPAPPLAMSYRIIRNKDGSVKERRALGYSRWARIKKAAGLNPWRDMRGTGTFKPKGQPVKFVGHLMTEGNISVRKVSENFVLIAATKDIMRKKFSGNRNMWEFSPSDNKFIKDTCRRILGEIKANLVMAFSKDSRRS
jgi:hypothetical protein